MRELSARGHQALFLERDVEWYASNRDLPRPPYGRVELYVSVDDLKSRFTREVREADFVMVGSYVPEGATVGRWVTDIAWGVTAFYDIDAPVTLAMLRRNDIEYLSRELIPHYHLYLSFTGGPILNRIEREYGSPSARPLYCSVDPSLYYPEPQMKEWDLGYMGTYSEDRRPALDLLLQEPARRWKEGRFVVAGSQYPRQLEWPSNVERIIHLAPDQQRTFYNAQRFTLNLTRADMIEAGYSPSVRLFEASACATPIISDYWDGLNSFFEIGKEILIARSAEEALHYLWEISEEDRLAMGERARVRVLAEHTAARRAAQLERYVLEAMARR
jgi:spore maturation protein CgeB